MKCQHAPSGCNYPEGECLGVCMNKSPIQMAEHYKRTGRTHLALQVFLWIVFVGFVLAFWTGAIE